MAAEPAAGGHPPSRDRHRSASESPHPALGAGAVITSCATVPASSAPARARRARRYLRFGIRGRGRPDRALHTVATRLERDDEFGIPIGGSEIGWRWRTSPTPPRTPAATPDRRRPSSVSGRRVAARRPGRAPLRPRCCMARNRGIQTLFVQALSETRANKTANGGACRSYGRVLRAGCLRPSRRRTWPPGGHGRGSGGGTRLPSGAGRARVHRDRGDCRSEGQHRRWSTARPSRRRVGAVLVRTASGADPGRFATQGPWARGGPGCDCGYHPQRQSGALQSCAQAVLALAAGHPNAALPWIIAGRRGVATPR